MKIRLLSIALILPFLFSVSCSLASGTLSVSGDGIYLIPKGYTGDVIIVFDQPDGIVPGVENGLNVYEIPGNGVLKVKAKGRTGIVNRKYFYVDQDGRREPIRYLRITGSNDIDGKPKDEFDGQIDQDEYENGIFIMNAGGVATTNTGGKKFSFTSFIVGTPKDSTRLYDEKEKRILSIYRESLQNENRN